MRWCFKNIKSKQKSEVNKLGVVAYGYVSQILGTWEEKVIWAKISRPAWNTQQAHISKTKEKIKFLRILIFCPTLYCNKYTRVVMWMSFCSTSFITELLKKGHFVYSHWSKFWKRETKGLGMGNSSLKFASFWELRAINGTKKQGTVSSAHS